MDISKIENVYEQLTTYGNAINVVISGSGDVPYIQIFNYLKEKYKDSFWYIYDVNMSNIPEDGFIKYTQSVYRNIKYWGLYKEELIKFITTTTNNKLDVLLFCEGSKEELLSKYNYEQIGRIKQQMIPRGDIKIFNDGKISKFGKTELPKVLIDSMFDYVNKDGLYDMLDYVPHGSHRNMILRKLISLEKKITYEMYLALPDELKKFVKHINMNHIETKRYKNNRVILPEKLDRLTGTWSVNRPLKQDDLPDELTELVFGYLYNRPIAENVLPDGLIHLQIGSRYDRPIAENVLPSGLTHLHFGSRPIAENDVGITHEQFGSYYDQPFVENVLPDGMTHLHVVSRSDADDVTGLSPLEFGSFYNQPIAENVLPSGLTHLQFGSEYNQQIAENVLPDGLTHLQFGNAYMYYKSVGEYTKEYLPRGLQYFIEDGFIVDKRGVSHVVQYDSFNQPFYLVYDNYPFNRIGVSHVVRYRSNFNQPFYENVLPSGLTHLILGGSYDHPIAKNVLPSGLKHLTFGEHYNQPIGENVLPDGLTHLTFGDNYNQPIDINVLPDSLTHLTFGEDYNKIILQNVLPSRLSYLKFGDDYVQPIGENILPDGLKHLILGDRYNHLIGENVLPIGLTHLKFGDDYVQPIDQNVLPKGLIHFDFGDKYDKLYDLFIVSHNFDYRNEIIKKGIASIDRIEYKKYITFPDDIKQLVKNIEMVYDDIQHYNKNKVILPDNLERFIFTWSVNIKIKTDDLPNSLTHLTFGHSYNQPIDINVLPTSLTHLTFGEYYNQPIGRNVLPDGLTHLFFGFNYTQQIGDYVLPDGLTHLIISDIYNHPIDNLVLPSNLRVLSFSYRYGHDFWESILIHNRLEKLEKLEYDKIRIPDWVASDAYFESRKERTWVPYPQRFLQV